MVFKDIDVHMEEFNKAMEQNNSTLAITTLRKVWRISELS